MASIHRVEYMLEDVDHIPVTMDYVDRVEAQDEIDRISRYPDLVMLMLTKLERHVQKDGLVKRGKQL